MDVTEGLKQDWTEEPTSEKMLKVAHAIPWIRTAVKAGKSRKRRKRRKREGVNQVIIA